MLSVVTSRSYLVSTTATDSSAQSGLRPREDVTRLVEKEVQEVEDVIRGIYPEAAFIE
uniref:Uncharacterized protein n=1 Tax=Peronospora matthiolae TaxID=2874970 RepID=A0AAV1T0K3_9STRA